VESRCGAVVRIRDEETAAVKVTSTKPEPRCMFCQKSRVDVAKLIESPDKHTYICEECALQQKSTIQPSSTLTKFFNRMVCSFCKKRVRTSRLYLSARDTQSGSYICKSCLSVCRQILRADETSESSLARRRPAPD